MSKHEHGSMDTAPQQRTFSGFVKTVAWAVVLILVFLVFLAVVNG